MTVAKSETGTHTHTHVCAARDICSGSHSSARHTPLVGICCCCVTQRRQAGAEANRPWGDSGGGFPGLDAERTHIYSDSDATMVCQTSCRGSEVTNA